MTLNVPNRTLFHEDNLPVLKGINSASIDLVATDPPFNKNRKFNSTPGSLADGGSFQDRWRWEPEHDRWQREVADAGWPQIADTIELARSNHSDAMGAFLAFMSVRLIECQRVLKPTGSLYLHCDQTASHYLKVLLDSLFGEKNFRREIIWDLGTASGYKSQVDGWIRGHDTILYYIMGEFVFNKQFQEHKPEYVKRFRKKDENGRAYRDDRSGGRRQYLDETPGVAFTSVWSDIMSFQQNSASPEIVGYPTQKPLKLYDRIIQASTNRGDVVLDPFAGCATTCVAAERAGRRWIGIDLWEDAHRVVLERLEHEGLAVPDSDGNGKLLFGDIHYTTSPPVRTDQLDASAVPVLVTPEGKRSATGRLSGRLKAELKIRLIQESGLDCAGCDRTLPHEDYLDIDHRLPVSDGGTNEFSNLCLLCQPCNRLKSNTFTLTGLRRENKKRKFMADQQPEHRQPQVVAAV